MSDTLARTLPVDLAEESATPESDTPGGGAPIPRRIMRARREAAEALELATASSAPTWSVAEASVPASTFGTSVPLDDDIT